MSTDRELLLRYSQQQDQNAFTELVRTHIDLVYSAALRRLSGDAHAAAEVTQQVFLNLARRAEKLARHPLLNAWLHASTRNAAANYRRAAQRRDRRKEEIRAMQEIHAQKSDADLWRSISGVLDEALDELSEADRRVIILRFFENHSYPAIAGMLGSNEDAVRMRVGRSLGKLRDRLERRGVASSTALLAGLLTTNAVSAAPAALAATISATAATSYVAGTLYFMSTTKILVAAGTVVVFAGLVGLALHRSSPMAALPTSIAESVGPVIPSAIADADKRAANLAAIVTPTLSTDTMEAEEKIAALRDILQRLPEQSIPELKLATSGDWHMAVDGKLETVDEFRQALSKLRSAAERRFGALVEPALRSYLAANKRQFPTDVAELQRFVGGEITMEMLNRYRVAPAKEIWNLGMGGEWIITQDHLIDTEYDNHVAMGPNGTGSSSSHLSTGWREGEIIGPVLRAYNAANGSASVEPVNTGQWELLLPFATTAEQRAIIHKRMQAELGAH